MEPPACSRLSWLGEFAALELEPALKKSAIVGANANMLIEAPPFVAGCCCCFCFCCALWRCYLLVYKLSHRNQLFWPFGLFKRALLTRVALNQACFLFSSLPLSPSHSHSHSHSHSRTSVDSSSWTLSRNQELARAFTFLNLVVNLRVLGATQAVA